MIDNLKTLTSTAFTLLTLSSLLAVSPSVIAEENLRWKVQTAFGTHLPVVGEPIKRLVKQLADASGGKIKLKVFEPGKLVPSFEITEAVKNNQLPAGFTWLGYDQGKIPAAALIAAVPFGMEPWEYAAWWYDGEGKQLAEALYASHNVHPVLCSLVGPETAGWFKKEINTVEDIKGLKIRFAGLGGRVLQEMGASVTMLPAGEIFSALDKGVIDASEFSLPIVDQRMGFDKVAKNNYFPGWHQTFTASHLIVNKGVWNNLPDHQRAMIDMSCTASTFRAMTSAEATQGEVVAGFAAKGVTARRLNDPLLRQLQQGTEKVMAAQAAKDADFKQIYQSQLTFMEGYKRWKKLAYLPRDF